MFLGEARGFDLAPSISGVHSPYCWVNWVTQSMTLEKTRPEDNFGAATGSVWII